VVRLGRKLYTTRRALAKLVKARPAEIPPQQSQSQAAAPKAVPAADARAAARAAYAAPLRVVRGIR